MKSLKMKQPSVLGRGHLGQQEHGKRFAKTHSINNVSIYQRRSKSVALPTPREFYEAEIEGLQEYSDNWAWGCCPFHPDTNPSFTVNLESGGFKCMSSSCGVSGGNIVSFVCELHSLDRREAIEFLGGWK